MAGKDPRDLRSNPVLTGRQQLPELPVNTVTDKLTVEDGPQLELMTRATPRIVTAVQVGYIYSKSLGSSYVQGRVDQLMRLAVAMDGQGRRDMIDSLSAGGTVPDAYYNGGSGGSSEYSRLRDE